MKDEEDEEDEEDEYYILPPVFQAVVAALKAHPLDADVQQAALRALLAYSTCSWSVTPDVPDLLDAVPPILAAMRAFPNTRKVQMNAFTSLEIMCCRDDSVALAVAAAGAMGLLIRAMRLGFTNGSAPDWVFDSIGAIALSEAALPQASACIDAAVYALANSNFTCGLYRHLEENSSLVISAFETLLIYLSSPITRKRAVQAGAWAAIRKVFAEQQPTVRVALLERLHAMQAAILMQAQEHAAAVQAAAYVALEAPQA